ncbi:hypothetical protein PG994_001651 [Apiospora phragmitis]|uniref:CFEM domain-containing protein n=1 Tax=Apiospora phragmitis TaxID=2905665 RepID=A0ABR1WU45_9PEZI
MKSAIMILGASALVSAQALPGDFPQCGTVCIPNMVNQASDFNCGNGDWRCLCSNKNFIYGVRDCSDQACPKPEDANAVKVFGKNQCASVGIDIEGIAGSVTGTNPSATTTVTATGANPSSGSAAASGSQSAVTTSDILSTITSDGSAIPTTVGQTTIFGGVPVPISTQDVLTTIVTDGSTITSTMGQSTIFSTPSGSSNANPSETQSGSASVISSASASEVDTTVTSGGSTFTTKTQAESSAPTNDQAPSSTSNPAAMKTVAPAGAFLAAAGFGLLML